MKHACSASNNPDNKWSAENTVALKAKLEDCATETSPGYWPRSWFPGPAACQLYSMFVFTVHLRAIIQSIEGPSKVKKYSSKP
jgi:hypothetical protein